GPAEPARRAELWRWREAHTEAVNALGPPVKLDVTVPGGAIAAFCTEVRARLAAAVPAGRCWLFGHVADGNVHVNVTGVGGDDEAAVEDVVLGLAAALGGSISAEHGIGTAKRVHLHLSRSPAEIAAMRAVKAALDPAGILNPGALLPPP
ncbi:MAG: FAD-binding oxidoreductase, partial [Acidimicrobiia bacterium]|nr:FAD-binding oxidoreductase [Acidimicrobiia bacterium]